MKYLLFQIYSPLVSWGEIAVGGERHSNSHPSKSAIIGLVSSALGIRRDEEKRLNTLVNLLGVGIKCYSDGSMLRDFHTSQVPKKVNKVVHYTRRAELLASPNKIGTILSRREYRCDALSVIAIYIKKESQNFLLESIEKALKNPIFHLYFGRKSCVPALPLAPLQVKKETLKGAFDSYNVRFINPIDESKPQWLQKIFENYSTKTIMNKSVSYFWEDGIESGLNMLHSTERYDLPSSRKRWQFRSRIEYMGTAVGKEGSNVSL